MHKIRTKEQDIVLLCSSVVLNSDTIYDDEPEPFKNPDKKRGCASIFYQAKMNYSTRPYQVDCIPPVHTPIIPAVMVFAKPWELSSRDMPLTFLCLKSQEK